jgi:hypothetical protein
MVALDCQEVDSIAITYCRNDVGKGGGALNRLPISLTVFPMLPMVDRQ